MGIVRGEIEELIKTYTKSKGSARRTLIVTVEEEEEFSEEDFIVEEDCHVMLSTDGWSNDKNKSPIRPRVECVRETVFWPA